MPIASKNSESRNVIRLPYRAWHGDQPVDLPVPDSWTIERLDPIDAPALRPEQIEEAIHCPIGTERLRDIAAQRSSAIIVVEDITRPTRVARILPAVLCELKSAGMSEEKVSILFASGAHRPMTEREIDLKIPPRIRGRMKVYVHDFMGNDVKYVGRIAGGPVYLNRHFLQADMRICIGTVMPHNETGFGGGAKLLVPGIAGHKTIAFLHGALPPRPRGTLDLCDLDCDRRGWIETVAQEVRMDVAVCSVVNSNRETVGLYVGDCIKAHRAAASCACDTGRTLVDLDRVSAADAVLANAYPLDTDPIQMGKAIKVGKEIYASSVIVTNAASDAIFYHGMGMGGGIQIRRLGRNLGAVCRHPEDVISFVRGAFRVRGIRLLARYIYLSFNHLAYGDCRHSVDQKYIGLDKDHEGRSNDLFVYSPQFPTWGFVQRYGNASLFRDWNRLCITLMNRLDKKAIRLLVLPCAPLQILCFTHDRVDEPKLDISVCQ